jgi:hypothetical protein
LSRRTRKYTIYDIFAGKHLTIGYLYLLGSTGQTSSFATGIFGTLFLRTILSRHGRFNIDISWDMRRRIVLRLCVMSGIWTKHKTFKTWDPVIVEIRTKTCYPLVHWVTVVQSRHVGTPLFLYSAQGQRGWVEIKKTVGHRAILSGPSGASPNSDLRVFFAIITTV